MEKELEELRRSRPKPPVGGDFTLSDCFYFTRQGIESIVDDEVHFFLLTHLQTLVLILKWKCFSHVCQLSILKSGDPAVHFWGAGVLELTDSHQQWFPVHKSEADAGLWPWHHCEILHPCPPQVEKFTLSSTEKQCGRRSQDSPGCVKNDLNWVKTYWKNCKLYERKKLMP